MTGFWNIMIVYVTTSMIACWGLNLQFGLTGVLNFSFIIFEAVGAYAAAVLTLGRGNAGQTYFWGTSLPFPLPWLLAGVVGAVLGLLIGLIARRRLRGDYEAIVMLVVSVVALYFVTADTGLLNGSLGLANVPAPFESEFNVSINSYAWFYSGLSVVACLLSYCLVRRLQKAPLSRALRAVRENEQVAGALGRDVARLRILVFAIGGSMAALAGAIQVQAISAWSVSSWNYPETFALFAAVIIGGRGNLGGVAFGAFLVEGLFLEGVLFLPVIGSTNVTEALQWVAVGVMIIGFMWFRPQGILPEPRRRLSVWADSRGIPSRTSPASMGTVGVTAGR
jgi:branched-chain amino acid transport system permease protein